MINYRKKELGQVFTLPIVAKLMSSLIVDNIDQNSRILDPCIGENIFFTTIVNFDKNPKMVGIECDESLINEDIAKFYSHPKRNLLVDSFFNYPIDEKFDLIIQNPPYVRQELLNGDENSKSKIDKSLNILNKDIPKNSNLYVYFILKSILHLKEGGKLVAIFYDSWLYSKFGEEFKKIILELGSIEKIIHLKNNAFEDVEIGATIVEFIKSQSDPQDYTKYYLLSSPEELGDSTNIKSFSYKKTSVNVFLNSKLFEEPQLDFGLDIFTDITTVSDIPIFRGISPLINKYFLFEGKKFDETVQIIKDVSTIKFMKVNDEYKYLLYADKSSSLETQKYLEEVKNEILLNTDKYKPIKKKIINQDERWYNISLKPLGNIIFNYYLRNNIDFILNDNLYYASDNFYVLKINRDLFEYFAILNSSFTKISVLYNSRSQGNGLHKIQLYDFKKIKILNLDYISASSKKKLKDLGSQLTKVNRFTTEKEDLIDNIDSVLIDEFNNHSSVKISKETLTKVISRIKDGF